MTKEELKEIFECEWFTPLVEKVMYIPKESVEMIILTCTNCKNEVKWTEKYFLYDKVVYCENCKLCLLTYLFERAVRNGEIEIINEW